MAAAIVPLITGAVSAGTTIWAANKQANAAQQAARQQTQAGTQALDLQRQIWQQSQANLQPWVARGTQAVNTLGSLMGLGAAPAGGGATGTGQVDFTGGQFTGGQTFPARQIEYLDTAGEVQDARRAQRLHAALGSEAPYGAQTPYDEGIDYRRAQTQSGYVTMQAPDGSTSSVPSGYVNHYTNLGARIVGGAV